MYLYLNNQTTNPKMDQVLRHGIGLAPGLKMKYFYMLKINLTSSSLVRLIHVCSWIDFYVLQINLTSQ